MSEEDLVEIAGYAFQHEAQLAASALRGAGIRCEMPDRFGFGRRSPQDIFTGQSYRVLVAESDVTRARDVLGLTAER